MKITARGQVTIPHEIREEFGLLPHTEVEFHVRDQQVLLVKATSGGRGRRIVDHLRGRGSGGMTTDEILALTRGDDA
jgi:AbrB family looped-hinge helix DNA binding protein